MQGCIAIIRDCCISDVQVKERQDRIIDSLNTVSCAIKNGIILGGGISLLYALLLLDDPLLTNKHFTKELECDFNIDSDSLLNTQCTTTISINRTEVGYDISKQKCLHYECFVCLIDEKVSSAFSTEFPTIPLDTCYFTTII